MHQNINAINAYTAISMLATLYNTVLLKSWNDGHTMGCISKFVSLLNNITMSQKWNSWLW